MKEMPEALKTASFSSSSRWKRWGYTFLAIHVTLFLVTLLGSSVLGFFYRGESPILFLLYSLPLYFDFPVSFLLSALLEAMKMSSSDLPFMIMLFVVGSCYWFFIGSLLGLIFGHMKK